MIKSFIEKYNLNRIGFLELIIALYPILSAYRYGPIPLSIALPFVLTIMLLFSRQKKKSFIVSFFVLFSIYIVFHEILWLFVIDGIPSYFVNTFISYIIFLISIFIIHSHLDYAKLEGAINWVTIPCLLGMIYHVILLQAGQLISPIPLPFLPEIQDPSSRITEILDRPTSFFVEPQSYASYMIVPMLFALIRKNYVWATIIGASLMISTSTTGIVLCMLLTIVYAITQKIKLKNILTLTFILFGLGYFLMHSDYTTMGLKKLENTDVESTARLINGVIAAENMKPIEWIAGVPYANIDDFFTQNLLTGQTNVLTDINGKIFISAFWIALVRFGFIGLFLLLGNYFQLALRCRNSVPYIVCLIVCLFSNSDFIGTSFVFQMLIILTLMRHDEFIHFNDTICQ